MILKGKQLYPSYGCTYNLAIIALLLPIHHQTVECDHEPQQDLDEQQRFSALEQLQDVYHEDERLRELENYKRGRGDSERLNSREGWDRENDWERDPSYV